MVERAPQPRGRPLSPGGGKHSGHHSFTLITDQKLYFNESWTLRPGPALDTCPNVVVGSKVVGFSKWARLKTFLMSERSERCCDSVIRILLMMESDQRLMSGPLKTLRPRDPGCV